MKYRWMVTFCSFLILIHIQLSLLPWELAVMERVLVKVRMADLQVAQATDRLRTTGIVSCVGVALYDPIAKIGGMAHVMLPNQALSRGDTNRAKYADTAIPLLIDKMEK